LCKTGITPDVLTWLGLVINIIAATVIGTGRLLIGGVLVLVAGLFDIFDGALARYTQKTSTFGSLLDSTFDRVSEAAVLFGLLFFSVTNENELETFLIFGVMIGSFLISYVRARSEGLGIDCRIGLFTRTERVIILALGLLFNQVLIALIVLAVFTWITFIQRMVYTWKQAAKQRKSN
jgi:CDP-diacylglycerol--glycerol-3-phosphate 3-phosphatidyltransferase